MTSTSVMRLVKQYHDEGCGLACVAMASGTTYAAVRRVAFPTNQVTVTSSRRIKDLMVQHGVDVGDRLIPFRDGRPEDLKFDALLKVNPRSNGRKWHWVMWDHKQGRVLDPKRPVYKRFKFISYLPLYR